MAADGTSLVLVLPDDTVEALAEKICAADARYIQLLVADEATALQTPDDFATLRRSIGDDPQLMVIGSDEQVLQAAQTSGIDVVPVHGTRVSFVAPPSTALVPSHDAETQTLPAPAPISEDEARFVDDLERVPIGGDYDDPRDDLDPLGSTSVFADEYEAAVPGDFPAQPADAAFADQHLYDDFASDEDVLPLGGRGRTSYADEDEAFARPRGSRRSQRLAVEPLDIPRQRARPAPYAAAPPHRRSALAGLLPLVLLLVIAAAAVFWFFRTRTTVLVVPPTPEARAQTFTNEVVPISAEVANTGVLQAETVMAVAEATVQGQASQQLTPSGVARGNVTIINRLAQPIALPEGTEFIGTNAQGQPVHFLIDAPATVPQAVTTNSQFGSSTTFGQIEVAVSARSPGSASNVEPNSIVQIVLPGGQTIQNGDSVSILQPSPITGGDEQPRYVVTEEDVRRVLGDALTKLLNESSIAQLSAQITRERFEIDPTTIRPDATALADPANYETPVVEPPIGTPLEDNNPVFRVSVRAPFSALATPAGQSVRDQLQTVIPTLLQSRCTPGSNLSGVRIGGAGDDPGWRWDGSRLVVDGTYTCSPGVQELRSRVLDAVRGQSRADAVANLQNLQQQGLIGDFAIPEDKTQLPSYDMLLDVQIVSSTDAPTQPGPLQPLNLTPQPTGVAQP